MIMSEHLRDFWRHLQTGVEVAVASGTPERLLGVRDAFVRFFHEGLHRPISVAVVPQPGDSELHGLPPTDEATIALVRGAATALKARLGDTYHFYVATEGGVRPLEVGGATLYFVQSWSAVLGSLGEALGGSGSVQLPSRLVASLGGGGLPVSVPGTRRQGGIISSLTAGLETRRRAVALSTFHALASLLYGVLHSRSPSAAGEPGPV
jgi:non-canonical (house-cleaning) NTP pyrophosphatase